MAKCRVIAIEGRDKLGKTTQVTNVTSDLNLKGYRVTNVCFPYKGLTYLIIRKMLAVGAAKKFPNVFQFIQTLNKVAFQLTILWWLRMKNDYIIFDRCGLSTLAYGRATGAWTWFTKFLVFFIVKPDLIVLLDGFQFNRVEQTDTYDADVEMQWKLRGIYLNVAGTVSSPVYYIDANQPVNTVTKDILLSIREEDFKRRAK
jgi:thymidylate kinase